MKSPLLQNMIRLENQKAILFDVFLKPLLVEILKHSLKISGV